MSSYTVKKISLHGINIFAFNSNEHQPKKPVHLAVVLRPTAEAIGLNTLWFVHALGRSRNYTVRNSLREIEFSAKSFCDIDSLSQKDGRGSRDRPYQCIPLTKLEVLLNEVDTDRLKNPRARASILNMQKTINKVIEHYYHRGAAVNPKISETQIPRVQSILQKRLEKIELANSVLTKENALLTKKNSSLEHKIERLTALVERINAKLDSSLSRSSRLAASVKRNVGRANIAGWQLMRKDELIEEQVATIEDLTHRVSANRTAKLKYKAMVAEYNMAITGLREDMPGFKSKKLSRLPGYLRMVLGQFLEATRDCFQSVLEQRRLTDEFRVMTLALFPELSGSEYDSIVEDFGLGKKTKETYEAESPVLRVN